jgi:signal transduction histidine kinase
MSNLNASLPQGAPLQAQQIQIERALVMARLFAALAALGALLAAPRSALQYADFGRFVLIGYAFFAAVVIIVAYARPTIWIASRLALHIVDIVAAGALMASTGANGPFFVLFVPMFLAAALRWGFAAAIATAVAGALVLGIGGFVDGTGFSASFTSSERKTSHFFTYASAASLLIGGAVIGYVASAVMRLCIESVAVASMIASADVRSGLKRTMGSAIQLLQEFFGAERVLLVVHDRARGKAFLWDTAPFGQATGDSIRSSELENRHLSSYVFEPDAATFHVRRRRSRDGERYDVVATDADGTRLSAESWSLPKEFLTAVGAFDGILAVGFDLGQEWTGRVFLIDPAVGSNRRTALSLARRIVRQVAPAVHNVYLMRRLRTEAVAVERGRVARELHDGVIQGVIGVEMEVAALSRRLSRDAPHVAAELNRLNGVLTREVVTLREFMQQMKPLDLAPDQLVDTLADFTQRFQRETGIATRFVTQLDHVALAPHACREVARIVGEALINVRRHSGAQNVYVRLTSIDGDCQLSIEDDGCGFPFSGRKSHAELEASRQGPFVIKDRVRLLGGQLNIESQPGQGARLEIAVPLTHHDVHA